MEDKGAACTCGWLNRHVVSAQRPEPRIRNATPAGLSSPFLRGSHRDRGCSAARLWFDDRGRSMHVRTADGANVSWRRFCVASRRQAIARGDPAREYGWGGCYSTRIRINEIHDGAARGRRDVPRLVGTSWGDDVRFLAASASGRGDRINGAGRFCFRSPSAWERQARKPTWPHGLSQPLISFSLSLQSTAWILIELYRLWGETGS